jgi:hypothetical protein
MYDYRASRFQLIMWLCMVSVLAGRHEPHVHVQGDSGPWRNTQEHAGDPYYHSAAEAGVARCDKGRITTEQQHRSFLSSCAGVMSSTSSARCTSSRATCFPACSAAHGLTAAPTTLGAPAARYPEGCPVCWAQQAPFAAPAESAGVTQAHQQR